MPRKGYASLTIDEELVKELKKLKELLKEKSVAKLVREAIREYIDRKMEEIKTTPSHTRIAVSYTHLTLPTN